MLRLVPANTKINFLGARFVCATLSVILLLGTVISLCTVGLNYGIDFAGGTLVEVKLEKAIPVGDVRTDLEQKGWKDLIIQQYGSPDELLIRIPAKNEAHEDVKTIASDVANALEPTTGKADIRRVEFVGPQVGHDLKKKGAIAIFLSILAILIYVTIRFEMRYAVGSVVALFHDVFIIVGVFSLTQREISIPVLAALLTVMGYSMNDTVVVYDRVRENMARFRSKSTLEILNISVNEMLNRTIMMILTVLAVLFALFYYGGATIHDFAYAMILGVLVGTFSSTYIASPAVLWLERLLPASEQHPRPGSTKKAATGKTQNAQ